MKRIFVLVMLLFFLVSLNAQDRGLRMVAAENLGPQASIGKQYALFIAIDTYRSWPALKKPVADAREIRDILKQQYYIDEVIELYNQQATRANITKTFMDLQSKLDTHDSLFIYYAGHGHLDEGSGTGFWIPVDGGTDIYSMENWLPNSQIRGYISRFKTIHVFMVSDSCFSGDILNTNRAFLPQIDNAYYRKAYGLTSRQVLTSGSSETVPDQSEFSEAIKNCLRKNTAPLLDPFGIYNDVRLSVRSTTPLYGTLNAANHQEGATFLFFRRQSAQPSQPSQTTQPTVTGGSITVESEIAGEIIIDGQGTGRRIKVGGTETITNVSTGATEVAVKDSEGKITKASQTVMVRQGQTVTAVIERPIPANMVRIQGGTFTMGSPANEPSRGSDEGPQHQVTVSSFYMGRYEVTQNEYQEVMGTNPSKFKGDNLPVEQVSWYDAVEYCNKRSQKEGLTPVYTINKNQSDPNNKSSDDKLKWTVTWNKNANGYRLPTEAEWEYACRAGTTTAYNTGAVINDNTGWYYANSGSKTHPVGQKPANAWGLYDMHGNVYEWCWDWFGNYTSGSQTDPLGASSGTNRVARGGGWNNSTAEYLRSAYRECSLPSFQVSSVGFRLVRP